MAPVVVGAVVVLVSVTVVSVPVVCPVVVSGGKVACVVVVNDVDVDFEPPHPTTNNAPKRTASRLTFAG
jgi:hypothetical protein